MLSLVALAAERLRISQAPAPGVPQSRKPPPRLACWSDRPSRVADRLPRSDKSEWPRLGRGRVLATSAEASRQDRPGAPVTTHLSHSLKPTWRFRLQRFCCLISRRASRKRLGYKYPRSTTRSSYHFPCSGLRKQKLDGRTKQS